MPTEENTRLCLTCGIVISGRRKEYCSCDCFRYREREPIMERFMRYIAIQSNGCWLWTGNLIKKGYGRFQVSVMAREAHRVSYENFIGQIPDKIGLDHECHRPEECRGGNYCHHRRCVNPYHLKPATARENNGSDRSCLGDILRERAALITHCPHGHDYTPENTKIHKGKRYCRRCNNIRSCERYHNNRILHKIP